MATLSGKRAVALAMLAAGLFAVRAGAQQPQQDIPDAPSATRPAQPFPSTPPPESPNAEPPAHPPPPESSATPRTGSTPDQNAAPLQKKAVPDDSGISPPPAMPEVKTVPAGSVPPAPPGSPSQAELYKITSNVNFVLVPVTVKDLDGNLVPGCLLYTSDAADNREV